MMLRFRFLSKTAVIFAALAFAITSVPTKSEAQGFFSWAAGSGRQVVSFPRKYSPRQIIVSFGDRKLYYVHRRGEAISYPIAVPRHQSRWQGTTHVSMKRVNPPWRPTPSMRRENPRLPVYVPGGHPRNPLGVRALYLGKTAYRIHGTDAPWTIGQSVSKGCIRMYNADVKHLYARIPIGTRVVVTWKRFNAI